VQARLNRAALQTISKIYATNSEAYENYLRGRFHFNKTTEEGLSKSVEYYQRAIAIDPQYALAYTGIADSYRTLLIAGFSHSPDDRRSLVLAGEICSGPRGPNNLHQGR